MSVISWRNAARAALALGLTASVLPAQAQFPDPPPEPATLERVVDKVTGKETEVLVQHARTYLSLSPLTAFQFTSTAPLGNGQFGTSKRNSFGPFIQLEKQFPLHPNPGNQPSSFAIGAWYWAHSASSKNSDGTSKVNSDRLGIYGQYNFNENFSVQATVGGATRGAPSGLFEYYSFLLYHPALPKKSRFSVVAGLGPYFLRSSVGDTGYTYTGGVVYRLAPRYSLSASYWKVNYNKPPGTFGTGIHNDLTRTNLSLVYTIN